MEGFLGPFRHYVLEDDMEVLCHMNSFFYYKF
jgi:hypothetical protein